MWNWLTIFPMVLSIGVGATIMLSNRRSKLHFWMAMLIYACSLWAIAASIPNPSLPMGLNTLMVRFAFVFSIAMAYAMLRFSQVFSGIAPWRPRLVMVINVVAMLASLTSLVTSDIRVQEDMITLYRSPVPYAIILAIIVAQVIGSIVLLSKRYMIVREKRAKRQTLTILLGFFIGAIVGLLSNVIIPNTIENAKTSTLAWIPITIWTLVLVYAVVRHRFLDVRAAIVRSVGYTFTFASVIGLYLVLLLAISAVAGLALHKSPVEMAINITVIIVVAMCYGPLKRFFDRVTNQIFYREDYVETELSAKVSSHMASAETLEELGRTIVDEIGTAMTSEQVALSICTKDASWITLSTKGARKLSDEQLDLLTENLAETESSLVEVDPYAVRRSDTQKLLSSAKYQLAYPLMSSGQIVGYFFLGPKRSRHYTERDYAVLRTIVAELAIVVENMRLVDDVRNFNEQLKDEVERATRELRTSNKKLLELDATKDEFVSMASHQLRTPLTSVKGYISMVLEGDAGKITPAQRQLLEEAFTSSERMVHLIGDFLNISRLQTGKFVIERVQSNLADVVDQEIEGIRQIANSHDIKVIYRRPKVFPTLYIDENKIRQVVMNFIDNAIYYSPEATPITVRLSVEDASIVLQVVDKGIGVPKDVQKKLFTKFFRAENARRQRPDGTGIGLYLAKKVISGHGGSVIFQSEPGKGSTFGFRLPIKKLSVPPVVRISTGDEPTAS